MSDHEVAKLALEGAIRNVETAAKLQNDQFMENMLEGWAYDYPEDHVFEGDTLAEQYDNEYSKRAGGTVEDGQMFDISGEAYEEIDGQTGVEMGLGIALDILRKMAEQAEEVTA